MDDNPYSSSIASHSKPGATVIGIWDYFTAFVVFYLASLLLAGALFAIAFALMHVVLGGIGAPLGMIQLATFGPMALLFLCMPVQFVCFRFAVGKLIVDKSFSRLG